MLERMEYFKIKRFTLYPSQYNSLLPKVEELRIIAKSTNRSSRAALLKRYSGTGDFL